MMRPRTIPLSALVLAFGLLGAGCQNAGSKLTTPATPVSAEADPAASEFNNLSRSGDTYFAGYPTEAGLEEMARRGVTTVIALKTPEQVSEAQGFDEQAVADRLGIRLVWLPVSPESFCSADVDAFADAFESADGPVLIHCGSANTAGGMWSAYLHDKKGISKGRALALGEAAGLHKPEMVEATERVMDEGDDSRP